MRIRNKLVTVQLIITITIILSIIIFSRLLVRANTIQDSTIRVNRLNSDINRLESEYRILLLKRVGFKDLSKDLSTIVGKINDNILLLEENPLLNTLKFRDRYRELRQSWVSIDAKSSYRIIQYFITDFTEKESYFNSLYGAEKGLKELEKWYNKNPDPEDDFKEISEKYNTLKSYYEDFGKDLGIFISNWDSTNTVYSEYLRKSLRVSFLQSMVMLVLLLIVSTILSFRITSKIPKNLNSVNNSLERMTKGDFSTNLNIEAGDEFGDLSRNFNSFVEQLWKKLDSMNVIMKDIGHAMGENIEFSKIQHNILNNITNHILSDAAGMMTLNGDDFILTAAKGHLPPFYPIDEDITGDRPRAARYLFDHPTSRDVPIVKECITTKKPVFIKECYTDPSFPQCRNKESSLYIGSLLMVPLIISGDVIGLIVLTRTNHQHPFSDLDFSSLYSFSDYAALTLDTINKYNELLEKFELQKEIGVAADIQTSLIPKKMPKIKGLTSSAFTLAAKGVSGDYYDFFRMNRNTVGATVCDVAGKGVPASLVMVMIRTILRLVASPKRGAAETLSLLNRSISGKIDIDRYATMGFFQIDLENLKLNFSNAAHHPIQIFRQSSRKFYAVDSPGLPVGIDRDSKFAEKRISLKPGDIIFMYTDGFPEARNPEGDEYSTNRMLREIRLHCHKNADEILNSVVEDMQKFTQRAKQHDDQTLLIVKIDEDN